MLSYRSMSSPERPTLADIARMLGYVSGRTINTATTDPVHTMISRDFLANHPELEADFLDGAIKGQIDQEEHKLNPKK